jgi:hypothetical protein
VQDLLAAGFDNSQVGLVTADPGGKFRKETVDESGNLASQGAVTGGASGLVVGGLIGLLVGATTMVGGPVGLVAAGPIAGLITGAGLGMVSGGLLGALVGLGIPEETAHVYAESVRRGSVLLSIDVPATEVQRAEAILLNAGAVNIEERAAVLRTSGWSQYDPNAPVLTEDEIIAERERFGITAPVTTMSTDPIPPAPPSVATGVVAPNTDDETYFRNHFLTNYPAVAGDYETFRPAYNYGYEFATKQEYRGMDWVTAETQARTMWEQSNPGTWDRFKDAIHAGWSHAGALNERTVNRAEVL